MTPRAQVGRILYSSWRGPNLHHFTKKLKTVKNGGTSLFLTGKLNVRSGSFPARRLFGPIFVLRRGHLVEDKIDFGACAFL